MGKKFLSGSGCGSIGREVASDTTGPRFESSHRQLLLYQYFLLTICRKDENKEKEAGNGPFFEKTERWGLSPKVFLPLFFGGNLKFKVVSGDVTKSRRAILRALTFRK